MDAVDDRLVLGIDGGGTRTRAALVDAGGAVLGTGESGPGNALSVPVAELSAHLAEAIGQAVPSARERARVAAVGAGFAGAAGLRGGGTGRVNALTALELTVSRLGFPSSTAIAVFSDTEAAFASAPGAPADGIALVAGTGAVAVRIARRRSVAISDGNGWLLGDEGSGFWIGRAGVRAALRASDGRGARTALRETVFLEACGVLARVPCDPLEYRSRVVSSLMTQPPVRLADFAPLVAAAAEEGDAVASGILDAAVGRLVETVGALSPERGELVVATGGLLGPGGVLTDRLEPRLAGLGVSLQWVSDGTRGAAALARVLARGAA